MKPQTKILPNEINSFESKYQNLSDLFYRQRMSSKKKCIVSKVNQLQFQIYQLKIKNSSLIQRNVALQQQLHKAIKIIKKYENAKSEKYSSKSSSNLLKKSNNGLQLLFCDQLADDPYALRYLRKTKQIAKEQTHTYFQQSPYGIGLQRNLHSVKAKSSQYITTPQNELITSSLNQISQNIVKISQNLASTKQINKVQQKQIVCQPLMVKINSILQKLDKVLNKTMPLKTDVQVCQHKNTDTENVIIKDKKNENSNSEAMRKTFTKQLLLSIGKQLKSWKFQEEEVSLSRSKSTSSKNKSKIEYQQ